MAQSSTSNPTRSAPPDTGLSQFRLVGRLLKLSWQFRAGCIKVLLLDCALLAITLAGPTIQGLGMDFLHHLLKPEAKPARWPLGLAPPAHWSPVKVLIVIAAINVVQVTLLGGLRYVSSVSIAHLVHKQILVRLRTQVYAKLQRLSFRFYDANQSGSIINRVTGDVQAVRSFIDGAVVQVFRLIVTLTACLVLMASINLKLTLACLATTPLLLIVSLIFTHHVKPAYLRNRELFDRLILALSENVQGVHVIKGFALEGQQTRKFEKLNGHVRDQQRRIFWWVSCYSPVVHYLNHINASVLLLYGGYLVIQGQLNLGVGLWVFLWCIQHVGAQIQHVANVTNSIQQSLTGARRVFEVLDAPVEIKSPPRAVRLSRSLGAVRFENVSFGYDPVEPVLHDISFEVRPGQCVAILGATGSGKSTLLSLIPRFYDPQKGRVLVDGVDVRQLNVDDLRRNVGLVFQESFLFSNTVANNIAFGYAEASQAQIERAASLACAHDFIMEMPEGYRTLVGERGVDLSGGQRQRLAIARALILEPPILLLDDALSAVDAQTEHEMLRAMDNAMQDRTTFVVAHRLSTLRRADLVLVLDRGRIVQRGTHEELINASGHYREAARLQVVDADSQLLLGSAGGRGA